MRAPQTGHGPGNGGHSAESRPAQEDKAEGPRQELGFRVQRVPKGRKWPASPNLPSAAFPDFQGDAGVKFLIDDFSRDKVAFARDGFIERAQNGQRVSVRSPVGAPHDWGVGDVLTEEGGKVWATVCTFGLVSGLRAVE